jgi:hypothetical protein
MVSPQQAKLESHFEKLIQEGEAVAASASSLYPGGERFVQNETPLHSWLVKVQNILQLTFGENSAPHKHYAAIPRHEVSLLYQIRTVIGILTGALSDLKDGFIVGQENLIAAEVFDSVIEQARHLNNNKYKDAAAVLGRVVLEDALKRMARKAGIDDKQTAARINDQLLSTLVYSQPQWRRNQALFDIGMQLLMGILVHTHRKTFVRCLMTLSVSLLHISPSQEIEKNLWVKK